MLLEILERHHFTCYKPFGAYYIMTDISAFGFADDVEFARYLVKDVGVAAVPGSSFYKTGGRAHEAAVLFLQADETLQEADRRLLKLVPAGVDASLKLEVQRLEGTETSARRPLSGLLCVLCASVLCVVAERFQYRATTPK